MKQISGRGLSPVQIHKDRRRQPFVHAALSAAVILAAGLGAPCLRAETGAADNTTKTLPPWLTTLPAFLVYIALALAVIFVVIHWRTRKLVKDKKRLEEIVDDKNHELKEASMTDTLTGLKSRRFLHEIVQHDISTFIKSQQFARDGRDRRIPVDSKPSVQGIFLIDLDDFKTVNESYGHDTGDRVLKAFAQIIRSSVREDDPVMRFGGEEFLVILKKTQSEYLDVFAKKIMNKIREANFDATEGVVLKKTCSLGYTTFPFYRDAPELFSLDQTILIADQGLYYAKAHGRNQAVKVIPIDDAPRQIQDALQIFLSLDAVLKKGLVTVQSIK